MFSEEGEARTLGPQVSGLLCIVSVRFPGLPSSRAQATDMLLRALLLGTPLMALTCLVCRCRAAKTYTGGKVEERGQLCPSCVIIEQFLLFSEVQGTVWDHASCDNSLLPDSSLQAFLVHISCLSYSRSSFSPGARSNLCDWVGREGTEAGRSLSGSEAQAPSLAWCCFRSGSICLVLCSFTTVILGSLRC